MSKFVGSSYEQPGASTPVMALKIFGYSVLAGIMCLFVYFSMTMIADGMLQMPVAYREYEVIDGEQVLLREITWEEYQEELKNSENSQVVTDDRRLSGETVMAPKNEICAGIAIVMDILEQLMMAMILVVMTGYYIYREGDRDRNLVRHHQREATPLRGLWIGLLASIPSAIVYALLILGKCGIMSDTVQSVYRLLNPAFTPLVNAIMPTSVYPATEIAVWQLLVLFLLLPILPATGAIAYQLGYKRVFKKKKKKA